MGEWRASLLDGLKVNAGNSKVMVVSSGGKTIVNSEKWPCAVCGKGVQTNSGSKQHSLQAVELSQQTQAAVQIVSNLPAPINGGPIYRFLGMRTCWMAGAVAHKSG